MTRPSHEPSAASGDPLPAPAATARAQAEAERTAHGAGPAEAPERCGPLGLERHRKADGRLLILYRWLGEDE